MASPGHPLRQTRNHLPRRRHPLCNPDLAAHIRRHTLAGELHLPVVCVIDTQGAALSVESEIGGLSGEIARTTTDLLALRTPSVSVLMGQGCGGAAIGLMAGDRVIAAENSWLSPLPLEGASAIMYRDRSHAAQMAQSSSAAASQLLADDIVDVVVPEDPPQDPQTDPTLCRRIADQIHTELADLLSTSESKSRRTDSGLVRRGRLRPTLSTKVKQ